MVSLRLSLTLNLDIAYRKDCVRPTSYVLIVCCLLVLLTDESVLLKLDSSVGDVVVVILAAFLLCHSGIIRMGEGKSILVS